MRKGNFKEANEACDEAIRLNPELAEAWGNKGNAILGQGNFREAIEAYDEAIRLYEKFSLNLAGLAGAWCSKGNALVCLNKYDEAIKACDEAIKFNPKLAEAWTIKGIALKAHGLNTDANMAFAKAKELGYNGKFRLTSILHHFLRLRFCII